MGVSLQCCFHRLEAQRQQILRMVFAWPVGWSCGPWSFSVTWRTLEMPHEEIVENKQCKADAGTITGAYGLWHSGTRMHDFGEVIWSLVLNDVSSVIALVA